MQLMAAPTKAEQVLAGLAQRRERLVSDVVAQAGSIGGYAELEQSQSADFAQTVREGLDAILRAMADQRAFGDDDVAFLWPHIRRRTEAGVSEGDMLTVVRLFQRAVWDAITELAGDGEEGRAATLILARPLIDYIDVLSRVVDQAFVEAEEALSSRTSAVRQEVVDALLSGRGLAPGSQETAARRAGLAPTGPLVVIVARLHRECADEGALGVAGVALARAAGDAIEPLAVVRRDEIVVVRATSEAEAARIAAALGTARERLLQRGISVAVGMSTVHDGLAAVPAAYHEACLALEAMGDGAGVLALCELGVADYLILRAGDKTAWRLVPPEVRAFVEDDARQGAVLSDTLLAYVGCDLSVKLAAERLFVHPNTAHYRLAKIENRTGCSVRRLEDVLLLAIAIRLARARRNARAAA
jgi:sugar diacid utilization regulator